MVPAIGEIALLLPHATGNQEGGGGTREPRPSEVARKQLIDEDARSKARALKAAQDARKDQQEDK
jgi:hypothetical protein